MVEEARLREQERTGAHGGNPAAAGGQPLDLGDDVGLLDDFAHTRPAGDQLRVDRPLNLTQRAHSNEGQPTLGHKGPAAGPTTSTS